MGDRSPQLVPLELRVLATMRDRVPGLSWDPRRVVLAVRDYEPYVDVEEVAARCADWLMSESSNRVKDGPGTLRAFLAKAKQTVPTRSDPRLSVYDRSVNSSPDGSARHGAA